jgi:membrane dipeptidase
VGRALFVEDQPQPAVRRQAEEERRAIDRRYPPSLATVADLVDHIDHIVAVAGIDHVGIGSDFDGGGGLQDCQDVAQMPAITRELLRRGYTVDEVQKIWSGNFLRVMRQAENNRRE